jgi:hypothetical protein
MDDIDWDNFSEDLLSLLQDYGMDSTTLEDVEQYANKFKKGLRTMIRRQELENEENEQRSE